MWNYKVGDRVLVRADGEVEAELYVISEIAPCSKWFPDHYRGVSELDGLEGLFTEDEIEALV